MICQKTKICYDNETSWIRIRVWNGGDLYCLKKLDYSANIQWTNVNFSVFNHINQASFLYLECQLKLTDQINYEFDQKMYIPIEFSTRQKLIFFVKRDLLLSLWWTKRTRWYNCRTRWWTETFEESLLHWVLYELKITTIYCSDWLFDFSQLHVVSLFTGSQRTIICCRRCQSLIPWRATNKCNPT